MFLECHVSSAYGNRSRLDDGRRFFERTAGEAGSSLAQELFARAKPKKDEQPLVRSVLDKYVAVGSAEIF